MDLHVAFRRGFQLDPWGGSHHFIHVETAGLFHRRFPQPWAEVGGLGHVADHRVFTVFGLEGFDEGFVVRVVQALEVLHRGIETGHVLAANAEQFVFGHRQGQQGLLGRVHTGCVELLVEGHVGAAHHGCEHHVRLFQLDLVDQRAELRVAQRVVVFTDDGAVQHVFNVLARDLHRGARPDVVRAHQVEGLGAFGLGDPIEAGEDLLGRFLTGVDHVFRLFQAFIEGRVVEQAILFFEDRQYGFARSRGPAAEHGGDLVVDQQLLGFFGEGRPVGGAVFLDHLDLASQDPARGVDLFDGQALGLDRTRLGNRHGAGGRVQLADGNFGGGHGQAFVIGQHALAEQSGGQ